MKNKFNMENKNSFWHSLVETINELLNPSEKVIDHHELEKEIYATAVFLLFIYGIIFYFSTPVTY